MKIKSLWFPEERVEIENVSFATGEPPEKYHALLGPPDRIVEGPSPAPYGHRNNQQHQYDKLGISLNEHHKSRLIQSVRIELMPERSAFPTLSSFVGSLSLCGIDVYKGTVVDEFLASARQLNLEFKPHLGWSYYIDGKRMSITLCTFSEAKRRGRTRESLIFEVVFSFRNSHLLIPGSSGY